jgi:hypothetical protein
MFPFKWHFLRLTQNYDGSKYFLEDEWDEVRYKAPYANLQVYLEYWQVHRYFLKIALKTHPPKLKKKEGKAPHRTQTLSPWHTPGTIELGERSQPSPSSTPPMRLFFSPTFVSFSP